MKRFISIFAFLILFAAVSLHAQTTNGSIEGSVTDPSGGAVAGASVTARNMDTGLTQATTTKLISGNLPSLRKALGDAEFTRQIVRAFSHIQSKRGSE